MMFSAVRARFTYANVVATLALVFAMSGGAYAASRYLITSTKQISPKVLKSLRGANGSNGIAGPAGAVGAAGAVGPQGPAGTVGAKGETGAAGAPGAPGAAGKKGEPGSPWTAGGTLPVGATETGGVSYHGPGEQTLFLPMSFSIPLAAELNEEHVEIVTAGSTGTNCTGTSQNPTAPSGFLCVYLAEEPEPNNIGTTAILRSGQPGGPGASKAGAVLVIRPLQTEPPPIYGTWAVTG